MLRYAAFLAKDHFDYYSNRRITHSNLLATNSVSVATYKGEEMERGRDRVSVDQSTFSERKAAEIEMHI